MRPRRYRLHLTALLIRRLLAVLTAIDEAMLRRQYPRG
jgi:hypothetical protein